MSKKKDNDHVDTIIKGEIISHNLAKKYGILEEVFINGKWHCTGVLKNKYHTLRRAEQALNNIRLNQEKFIRKYKHRFTIGTLEYNLNSYNVDWTKIEEDEN